MALRSPIKFRWTKFPGDVSIPGYDWSLTRSEGDFERAPSFPPIGSFLTSFVSSLPIGCSEPIRVGPNPHSISIVSYPSRSQHPVLHAFNYRLLEKIPAEAIILKNPVEDRAKLHAEPIFLLNRFLVKYTFIYLSVWFLCARLASHNHYKQSLAIINFVFNRILI